MNKSNARTHTLASIAAEQQVRKRAVQNWLAKARQAHNCEFGTLEKGVRYFSDQEREALLSFASGRSGARNDKAATAAVDAATVVEVEVGNHCMALTAPEVGGQFSLERFRAEDISALVFDDPESLANQFIAVADQIVDGMEADIKAREHRLNATRSAQSKVAAKAQRLELEARLYRMQTTQIDSAQTNETLALQDAFTGLQSLGKSPHAMVEGEEDV